MMMMMMMTMTMMMMMMMMMMMILHLYLFAWDCTEFIDSKVLRFYFRCLHFLLQMSTFSTSDVYIPFLETDSFIPPRIYQGYIPAETLPPAHLLTDFSKSSLNYPTSHGSKLIFINTKLSIWSPKFVLYPWTSESSSSNLQKSRFFVVPPLTPSSQPPLRALSRHRVQIGA